LDYTITKYTLTLLLNLHHLFHPDELGATFMLCMAEGFLRKSMPLWILGYAMSG